MKKNENSILAIEFDAAEIRIAEVERAGGGLNVAAATSVPMPEGGMTEHGLNVSVCASAISSAINGGGFKSKTAVVGIDGASVIYRMANFPKVSEDRMRSMVLLQSQEFLPIPVIEVEIDYLLAGDYVDDAGATRVNAFLVATRKNYVGRIVEICKELKLTIEDICPVTTTLATYAMKNHKQGVVMMAKLDKRSASAIIFTDGVISSARTITVNPDMLANSDMLASTVAEEFRALLMYHGTKSAKPVEKLITVKMDSAYNATCEVLGEALGINSEQSRLFADVKVPTGVDKEMLQGCIALAADKLGG